MKTAVIYRQMIIQSMRNRLVKKMQGQGSKYHILLIKGLQLNKIKSENHGNSN